MAIAMLIEFPGVGQDQYDLVMRDLDLSGKTAAGGIFHVAGPVEGGWRVVDVWESREAFDTFLRHQLGPALEKHGIKEPKVSVWEVYATLTPTGPARAAGG